MGILDILEDSDLHGTPTGFASGCKTHHCPAPMSCVDVAVAYRRDYSFARRYDSGMAPVDIVAVLASEAREARVKARVKRDRKNERPRVFAEHGTRAGYNSRDFYCRRDSECPNELAGGISCAEAQRLYVAQRRAGV